jgi:hypothetical protein
VPASIARMYVFRRRSISLPGALGVVFEPSEAGLTRAPSVLRGGEDRLEEIAGAVWESGWKRSRSILVACFVLYPSLGEA